MSPLYKPVPPAVTPEKLPSWPFAQINGVLGYIVNSTRGDCKPAVAKLQKRTNCFDQGDIDAQVRVCQFLLSTKHWEFNITEQDGPLCLRVFSDSSYADDPATLKSTFGFITFLDGNAVDWQSSLLPLVTLSTGESEYMSAVEAGKSSLFTFNLLNEILQPTKIGTPVELLTDNSAAEHLLNCPVNGKRTKHIAVRWHWLRDLVKAQVYKIVHVPTHLNVADLMTKPLDAPKFHFFASKLLNFVKGKVSLCTGEHGVLKVSHEKLLFTVQSFQHSHAGEE